MEGQTWLVANIIQMSHYYRMLPIMALAITLGAAVVSEPQKSPQKTPHFKVSKTEQEWKKQLSPQQYRVLREAATDPRSEGGYTNTTESGSYHCGGCDQELFKSDHKFHSGCGWPSFYAAAAKDHVVLRPDHSYGMDRVEVLCSNCGGHLGHIFKDGPPPTGQRYCINTSSLKFVPAKKK